MLDHVRSRAHGLVLALSCAALAAPALAEARQEPAGEPSAMSAEEQEMMAAWTRALTPGEPHRELAAMAGSWTFEGTFWMAPGAPPMQSAGTAERTVLLGGRVLQETVRSTMFGQPFEGLGFTGYDNVTGAYWATWTDNMSTGVMISTGSCAEKRCAFTGSYNDPMTGKARSVRMTSRHEQDREVHEMFDTGPDGVEFKGMELVYSRKK